MQKNRIKYIAEARTRTLRTRREEVKKFRSYKKRKRKGKLGSEEDQREDKTSDLLEAPKGSTQGQGVLELGVIIQRY